MKCVKSTCKSPATIGAYCGSCVPGQEVTKEPPVLAILVVSSTVTLVLIAVLYFFMTKVVFR